MRNFGYAIYSLAMISIWLPFAILFFIFAMLAFFCSAVMMFACCEVKSAAEEVQAPMSLSEEASE